MSVFVVVAAAAVVLAHSYALIMETLALLIETTSHSPSAESLRFFSGGIFLS